MPAPLLPATVPGWSGVGVATIMPGTAPRASITPAPAGTR